MSKGGAPKWPTGRNDFAPLLCELGLTGFAAEIGVAEGDFSFYLLDRWPGVCYQIDPWAKQDTPGYSVHGDDDQDARFARVQRRAEAYRGRARPLRMTSAHAALQFGNDRIFGFVYIDAIHTYESCREDLGLWWPKVQSGGILAGHDYLEGHFNGQDYGVKTAVDEFAGGLGLKVHATLEPDWPSWFLIKP